MHWSEFIGGSVVISPPYAGQVRFNAGDIEVRPRIDQPVEFRIVEQLSKKLTDFRRAYFEDGLRIEEFETFPPTRRTAPVHCRLL
jgi:transaldolase